MDRKVSLSNLIVFSTSSSSAATCPSPLRGEGEGGGDVILVIAFGLDSSYQNNMGTVNEEIDKNS
jgi:hypothetical protein